MILYKKEKILDKVKSDEFSQDIQCLKNRVESKAERHLQKMEILSSWK